VPKAAQFLGEKLFLAFDQDLDEVDLYSKQGALFISTFSPIT
jgi:hypothetical protein